MYLTADPGLLDDPVWHALTGPHRRFAAGSGDDNGAARAHRYRVDVAPFGALQDVTDAQAWRDLAGSDAAKAHQAIWSLIAAPADALALLTPRLKPVEAIEEMRIERLIVELDSDAFAVRERATDELRTLSELAVPAYRKALAARPSLEMRRRLQGLLDDIARPSGKILRQLRALEVLERIGTPEARTLLETLARGAAGARLSREARAAVQRLSTRGGDKP